jgi:LPS-assembly protein
MKPAGFLKLACLLLAVSAAPALAQSAPGDTAAFGKNTILGPRNGKMLLHADHVDYDTNTGVSVAEGNVEIDYNDRILLADRVTNDPTNDVVTASGHVVMMSPRGDVAFADHMRLTDQMHDMVMESLSALIGENGRLVAAHATRVGGVRTLATHGIYTPCKICDKPGQRTPDWSVKAEHVFYDEVRHRIYYRDATMELFGVPVFYTPLFSHPDPTVKHASGILVPDLGSRSTLGYFMRIPFYVALSDSEDATLAPLFSLKGGEQLAAEYRVRWEDGGMWLQPTVANDPHAGASGNVDQTYTSLFGAGTIPLSDAWHVGYAAQLTSYASYLQRYDISGQDRLNNDLFVEGMSGRSRFQITGYFFQGLRAEDNNNQFPVVLPLIEYNYVPRQDVLGGQFRFDVTTAAISRRIGEDDQRLTGEMNWKVPYVTDNGQLYTFEVDARGDLYHTSEVNALEDTGLPDSQYIKRGAPYAALDWRWPFVSDGPWGMTAFVLEPVVQLVAAPYGDNPKGIPNETGYGVTPTTTLLANSQLDNMDVFSINRLPGYDLVESGPRANFGVQSEALFPVGSVDWLLGETLRPKPNPIFASGSGFDGTTSDIVSSVIVNFPPHLSISDRIDVDASSGTLDRNEASIDATYGRSSLGVSYLKLPSQEVTLGLGSREELKAQALVGLWGNWVAFVAAQRDLAASEMIADQFGLGYDDDCLGFSLSYERQYTQFRELPPSTSVIFRFTLKTTEVPVQRSGIFPEYLYAATPL